MMVVYYLSYRKLEECLYPKEMEAYVLSSVFNLWFEENWSDVNELLDFKIISVWSKE